MLGRPQGTHCKSGCGLTPWYLKHENYYYYYYYYTKSSPSPWSFPYHPTLLIWVAIFLLKTEKWFPVTFLSVFYGDTFSSVSAFHHTSFFLLGSGMWGSLIPTKTQSSTTHSSSTWGPHVGGMVGCWGTEAFLRRMPLIFHYNIYFICASH